MDQRTLAASPLDARGMIDAGPKPGWSLELREVVLPLTRFRVEVDLSIGGRVTGLFGPSGSGKTSLLDLIAGLRRPSSARISLGGRPLTDTAAGVFVAPDKRRIGYVPQEGALFPHLSVRRNLLYGRRSAEGEPPFSLGAVAEILEITHLLERRDVTALSGGERQRVALARALLSHPELLLLDEPLAALDAGLKERILPYLFRVRDEFRVPMLVVTHAPAEVMALCDFAVQLDRGTAVASGAPGDIFERVQSTDYVLRPFKPSEGGAPSSP